MNEVNDCVLRLCLDSGGGAVPTSARQSDPVSPLTITDAEAEEIYRYTVNSYLDPNKWPNLRGLICRIEMRRDAQRA